MEKQRCSQPLLPCSVPSQKRNCGCTRGKREGRRRMQGGVCTKDANRNQRDHRSQGEKVSSLCGQLLQVIVHGLFISFNHNVQQTKTQKTKPHCIIVKYPELLFCNRPTLFKLGLYVSHMFPFNPNQPNHLANHRLMYSNSLI